MLFAKILGWLVYTAALGIAFVHVVPCPDLAVFDYAGWIVSEGGTPYVDVIEQNWPGAIWMHTASTKLFGAHLWSFRVLDYALMCLAAVSLFGLLQRGGRPLSAWIVVPLYQAMYVVGDVWVVGQRDIVAAHLLLPAAWACVVRWQGGRWGWAMPLGIVAALCTLIRPTYLLFPVLTCAADLMLAKRNGRSLRVVLEDTLLIGSTTVAVLGAVALAATDSGALAGWYDASVLFNVQLYSRSMSAADVMRMIGEELRTSWHWYVVFAFVGAVFWWRRGERNVFAMLVSLFILGLVSVFVQGKGLGYHLGPWLPVLAAFSSELVALALQELLTPWSWGRSLRVVGALVVCAIAVGGSLKKIYGSLGTQFDYLARRIDYPTMTERLSSGIEGLSARDMLDAAEFAARHARHDETVLVWSRAVAINFLAQRRLPTPLATVGVLNLLEPSFARGEVWLSAFERTLQVAPPVVVFASDEKAEYYALFEAPEAPRATEALRSTLRERYRKVASFGNLGAYVLQGASP